ncbi:hypothetical protein BSP38_230 [Bacillus phage BSP38]|uniref:Uncharacterized protein n=1 Tax=Bacillus phage BSP38 TaxID=2283013 RepID=A0A345MK90_BPBSP|nr:hypothetical protein HWB82_gp088 [Bacillus phage BSP38]AXH71272.1 hypothetical protein BSP38_230 [Bacillus phage BSP38]
MSNFTLLPVNDIIELYSSCLREGIADQEEKNYRTKDGSITVIVSPSNHYIEAYSKHIRVVRLYFMKDNITWGSAITGESEKYHLVDLAAALTLSSKYETIKIEKGLYFNVQ